MLESRKPLVFIRAERNKGYSEKKQKDYDFANITLSDGLESLKVDINPELVEHCHSAFKKGDKVAITVDITEMNSRTVFVVTEVKKAA